jgi:hypothetical protein
MGKNNEHQKNTFLGVGNEREFPWKKPIPHFLVIKKNTFFTVVSIQFSRYYLVDMLTKIKYLLV